MRISAISYLNTAPLMWDFEHGSAMRGFEISYTVPSQCAAELERGSADIGILPSAAYATVPGLAILPGVANAAALNQRMFGLLGSSVVRSTPVMIGPVPTLAALNCVNSTPVPMVLEGACTRISPPDRYCWTALMVQLETARFVRKLSVFSGARCGAADWRSCAQGRSFEVFHLGSG